MRHRVITSHFSGWVEPSACFSTLSGGSEPLFWLDSGVDAPSGMSCLGVGSRVVTEMQGTLYDWSSGASTKESVFDFLRRVQAPGIHCEDESVAFSLGWVGWLGYELHEATMRTGLNRLSRCADAAFLFADRAVVFDHASRSVTLVALGDSWSGELAEWKKQMVRMLATLGSESTNGDREPCSGDADATQVGEPVWAYTDGEYVAMIEDCQQSIRAGNAYQLCLTTEVTLESHPDPVDTYLRLRELSPSHHGGFIRIGDVSLLSSSPEKFLTVTVDGVVESQPIKGTRRRGSTSEEDAALHSELLSSEKERAENLMIVDLVRNDLSRVCEVGSVAVTSLLVVESYAQVHQLVSTVRGKIAAGFDAVDAVTACFPAGSMTGAPKLSALHILDTLEQRPRGIYSGAWGYFGLDGTVDLAMTIRSIVIDSHGVTIGTGGGITALSVPVEELEETRIKAAALLRALGLVTL